MIDFSPFLSREAYSVSSCLLSCSQNPSGKGVYLKRKEFAPKGVCVCWGGGGGRANSFHIDPFSEGSKTVLIE